MNILYNWIKLREKYAIAIRITLGMDFFSSISFIPSYHYLSPGFNAKRKRELKLFAVKMNLSTENPWESPFNQKNGTSGRRKKKQAGKTLSQVKDAHTYTQ